MREYLYKYRINIHFCEYVNDNLDIEEERECEFYAPAKNAERIRNMTNEELAEILGFMAQILPGCYGCPIGKEFCDEHYFPSCERAFEKWLQSPVEE